MSVLKRVGCSNQRLSLMNKILPGVQWHAAPIESTLHRINGRNQSNWKFHVYHSQMYNVFLIESNKIFVLSFQNTDLAWHIQVLWRKENYLQLCYKFQKRPNLFNVLILRTNLMCSDMRKSDTRIWFCGWITCSHPCSGLQWWQWWCWRWEKNFNRNSSDYFIYLFIYFLLLSFSF